MESYQQLKQNYQSGTADRDYCTGDSKSFFLCKPLLLVDIDRHNVDHMFHTTA